MQSTLTHKKILSLREIEISLAKDLYIVVGFPKEKQNPYPDGQSVADVAYINEYGSQSQHIPSRPFMRGAMSRNNDKYAKLLKISTKKILDSKSTKEKELLKLGLEAKNDIQEEISRIRTPKNSSKTIKAKKSDKPLIDTGHMRQSVSYELRSQKEYG